MKPITFILLSLAFTFCKKQEESKFNKAIQDSKNYIHSFMDSNKIPGMSVAVSHKRKIIWSEGFGYANIEQKAPINNKSKFKIASVSKPLTAVLTAYLYQNNSIDIDKNIHSYLPDFPVKKWEFTTRQLMSHAAGIRHYKKTDINFKRYHNSIKEGLNIIKKDTLLYKPGSRCHYSSYGYNIIGAIIEETCQNSFSHILKDSLFTPLGMNNSIADNPFSIIPNRVSAYTLNEENEIINAPFFDNRYKIPSGGILSTAEDLVIFGNKIIHEEYLNQESINLLFTPFEYFDEKDSDTGFGWITTKDEQGNILYGHLGGITGGCSAIMIYPEKELVIVWLGNLDANWSDKPTKNIANFFLTHI